MLKLNIYWYLIFLYLVLKIDMYEMDIDLDNGSHEDGEFCFKKQ